ncbi:MAG: hypothetical protein ACREHV_10505 [Rhizomicrobium sp.]
MRNPLPDASGVTVARHVSERRRGPSDNPKSTTRATAAASRLIGMRDYYRSVAGAVGERTSHAKDRRSKPAPMRRTGPADAGCRDATGAHSASCEAGFLLAETRRTPKLGGSHARAMTFHTIPLSLMDAMNIRTL